MKSYRKSKPIQFVAKRDLQLFQLPNRPEDYNQIFDLYLLRDCRVERVISFKAIHAIGIGLDGERQTMMINRKGEVFREYYDNSVSLPVESGKIFYMLNEMGYVLHWKNREQAKNYHRYVIAGVSNIWDNFKSELWKENSEFHTCQIGRYGH